MFKLVVLSALLALAAAKPSLSYSTLLAPAVYAAPSAVSHQSRVDVHSSPAIAYSSPILSAYSAPLVSAYSTPVISAYSAPLVSSYASELALHPHSPANVIKATGVPLETVDVVNARNAHYTAKALNAHGIYKRSLAYSPLVSPYSVPALSAYAYSAPVVSAYSVPAVSAYSTPVLSAYSAPLVSQYHTAELALARGHPANVIKATGVPLETVDVVNARNAHYTAKTLNAHGIHKRSIAAYSTLVAPTAVSHQSRVDVHSSPVVAAYSAPVVSAYSTPVVSAYSAPLVSAHSSPLISAYSSPLVSAYSSPLVSAYSSPLVSGHAVSPYNVHSW